LQRTAVPQENRVESKRHLGGTAAAERQGVRQTDGGAAEHGKESLEHPTHITTTCILFFAHPSARRSIMQEREMRERVERFLKLRLRNTMMPAALGLGFALADCRPQVPPNAGPATTAQQTAAEPVGDLQRPDGVAIYSAPMMVGPGHPPKDPYKRLEWSGVAAWLAVQNCDQSFLRGAILSQSEFASVTAEMPIDVPTYQKMMDEWLEKVTREFCTPPPEGTYRHLGGLNIKDVLFVPAGTQWKRKVVVGLVSAYVFKDKNNLPDREPRKTPPLAFLDFEGRWRILVTKWR
jgi:hypothetical protein